MNVFDALSQRRNPMFWKLKRHDVSGIEVDLHMGTLEAIHELNHIRRAHEIGVEENVLDIEKHLQLLSLWQQLSDSRTSPFVANSVGNLLRVLEPGNIHRAGNHQEILGPEMVRGADHS